MSEPTLWVFNIVYVAYAKLSRSLSFFISVSYAWLKYVVTELILGRGGLGEESNYDYFKLKRKGKERKSNTNYFIINTSVYVR
jgi:hypothetical protein